MEESMRMHSFLLTVCLLASQSVASESVNPPPHPLQGRIWDVAAKRFISAELAYQRAAASRYVLLGEKHDSEHHHAGQLMVLQALAARGVTPALAMEQMDAPHQSALSAAQQSGVNDAELLADAGQLNRKGWRWPAYKALIAFAAERQWPLLAANLPRLDAREIAMGKVVPLVPAIDDARRAQMELDVVHGHCGQRPDAGRLRDIVLAQRARDVQMAKVLDSVNGSVVLIAGSGHVLADRAVPQYLAEPQRALVLAFVELDGQKLKPVDYDSTGLDLLWFTPPTPRLDPCAVALTGSVASPKLIITPKEMK
jgi:uncharacterized iron-regulated protein